MVTHWNRQPTTWTVPLIALTALLAAYGAALDLLARKVLPLLEGSTLLDLKVTPDEQQPGRTDLPPPPTSVETAP